MAERNVHRALLFLSDPSIAQDKQLTARSVLPPTLLPRAEKLVAGRKALDRLIELNDGWFVTLTGDGRRAAFLYAPMEGVSATEAGRFPRGVIMHPLPWPERKGRRPHLGIRPVPQAVSRFLYY